jgi:hypothetical protein
MSWNTILDIAAALIVLGLLFVGVYEMLAIINLHIPFTKDIPLITSIVRPWVMANKMIALGIAAIVVASFFWLFFHFFLSA